MIKITKPILEKALIAGFFSAFTIGVLTVLTYKSTLGYFLAGSFGSSMVLLFGFPESPFAQPKNVFFGHLLTAFVGVVFVNYIPLPIYINIALAVGVGVLRPLGGEWPAALAAPRPLPDLGLLGLPSSQRRKMTACARCARSLRARRELQG